MAALPGFVCSVLQKRMFVRQPCPGRPGLAGEQRQEKGGARGWGRALLHVGSVVGLDFPWKGTLIF